MNTFNIITAIAIIPAPIGISVAVCDKKEVIKD